MIEINPNIRGEDNCTYTYTSPREVHGYSEGDAVVVYSPGMRYTWPATITHLERLPHGDVLVEFHVSWEKGKPYGVHT